MGKLKIGWASRDISTDMPVNLPGQFHMRISRGVMDPVTVSALVIDNGCEQAIFLSADMVAIRARVLDIIREKVAAVNPEVPVLKILMNITHAHTGGSTYDDARLHPESDPDHMPYDGMDVASSEDYRALVTDMAAQAVLEAWDRRGEGGVAYGYGYAVVSHSRRVVYIDDLSKREGDVKNSRHGLNGHAAMYGNTNDDMFSHYEAGADHFINIMYTFDASGALTGAIINVPCPSQNSEAEYYLTADYWNDVRVALRKKYGDIFVLPQCAAAGDLSPRILHYKQAQARRFKLKYAEELEKVVLGPGGPGQTDEPRLNELAARKDIAERIVAAFDEVLSWAGQDIRTELKMGHIVDTVYLSRRMITPEEYLYCKEGLELEEALEWKTDGTPEENFIANSIIVSGRNRYRDIIKRYELQVKEPKLAMELHVINIGDVAFASNQFELYMDYQHRMQARSPFEQTFIVQLSGTPGMEGGSYLCTERGEWGRGYSASMFCNQVSPAGGQELVEETLKRLNILYDRMTK